MSGWVKWEKDKEQEPGFKRLVRKVRNTCVTQALQPETAQALAVTLTMGALLKFWSYADTYIRADDTLDMGLADIDDLVAIPGFAAALPADWLRVIDDEHVELPGYQQHNGIAAKKSALAQKRMENKRTRDQRNDSVTPRAQARNGRVTGASPDQTRPDQTKTETILKSDAGKSDSRNGRVRKDGESTKQNWNGHNHLGLTFEQAQLLQAAYPVGTYRQSDWIVAEKLINQHLANGVEFERILASMQRYRAQQAAKENIGGDYVASPIKHCSLDLPQFDEPFPLPKTKAEVRQDANADAGAAWLARSESDNARN